MPSLARRHFSFNAQSFVSLRSAIIRSLIRIGVSPGLVLGRVDCGSRATSPLCMYADTHRSRERFPYKHTFVASASFISLLTMGSTHLSLSSLIVFAIHMLIPPFWRKPPYVCAHYRRFLTFNWFNARLLIS